jgi:20S proteasome alpha/beta subunit
VTVAIGLVCKDGVLVASDSMASDPQTAHNVKKVFRLDCCPVVWTASGSVYVIEEVQNSLRGIDQPNAHTKGPPVAFAEPNLPALRSSLKGAILRTMQTCYQGALASTPIPVGQTAASFVTSFLVLGYANSKPWFLEFAQDGQVNWHTDFGFYAIGSGGPFARVAHGLMAHYLSVPLSLRDGMKVAYRAIETTCEVSSSSVGLPVQIALVDGEGPRVLDPAEISEIGDLVARWKTLEVDTLTMDFGEAQTAAQGDLPTLGDQPKDQDDQEIPASD